MIPLFRIIKRQPYTALTVALIAIIMAGVAIFTVASAQTDASVTPLTPGWGGPNYDQPLWTITYDKAIIPVSFTSYNCTSAALVLEYATWADYTKLDWQTGATNKYTGFIPSSASDLSQKVYITIPNLSPSTSYIFRVGAKCTSSSPIGSLVYTASANQFATPAAPASKTYSGRAEFQYGDSGGSIENNTLLTQKVINLRNTGSDPDTFRTTLLVNPETRCGLKGPNDSYPANTLPNTLPTTLDVPLAVNETKYISVACVTKGLPTGPFTWGFKTVSVGAFNSGSTAVIAEQYDTVNVTEPIPCSDSDGGINSSAKGIATGTYAGAVSSYIAIYGQEPNPNTPKTTTDKFSTFIDHCSWDVSQLNEGYCDANGRLQAIGIKCPNGCKDGVCSAPQSSSSSASSARVFFICSIHDYDGGGGTIPLTRPIAGAGYAYTPVYQDMNLEAGRSHCAELYEHLMVQYCSYNGNSSLGDAEWDIAFYDANGNATLGGGATSAGNNLRKCPASSLSSVSSLSSSSPSLFSSSASASALSVPLLPIPTMTTPAWQNAATSGYPGTQAPLPTSIAPSSLVVSPSTGIQSTAQPTIHQAPTSLNLSTMQIESRTVQKILSKSKVQAALKKKQQTIRLELRSLERSLLRKKNVAALGQVADLRDELLELDLHDSSAADAMQSLQEEIAALRSVIAKKVKR